MSLRKRSQRVPSFEDKGALDCCNGLIYAIDPSQFSNHDLKITLESLEPHRTLLIAVLVNELVDGSTEMSFLIKFLRSLKEYNDHRLATMPTKLQLCCAKYLHRGYTD